MPSTGELVEAVRRGDNSAFEELVRRYERTVIVTAWPIVGDFHAAQDTAQDSFVIAFRKLDQLREPENFGPWILSVVRREARRRQSNRVRQPRFLEHEIESKDLNFAEQHEEISRLLASLPDNERTVVVMKYLDGQTAQEIADLLQRPVGTVTKQLSRAIQRLRNMNVEVNK